MKVCFISDTHNQHDYVKIPECDMLIHSGDISGRGTFNEIAAFLFWFNNQKPKIKIFIAGNHEHLFEKNPDLVKSLLLDYPNIIYLENSMVEIEGLKIYGSPQTPYFYNWAFNVSRGNDIKKYWDKIPKDIDILITHGPAFGLLDETITGYNVGCEDLKRKIIETNVFVHVFGHIHYSHGYIENELKGIDTDKTCTHINAAILDEDYKVKYNPILANIDIENKKITVI